MVALTSELMKVVQPVKSLFDTTSFRSKVRRFMENTKGQSVG